MTNKKLQVLQIGNIIMHYGKRILSQVERDLQ